MNYNGKQLLQQLNMYECQVKAIVLSLQTTNIKLNTQNKSGMHVWNLFDINAPFVVVVKSPEVDLFWISDNQFLNKLI